VVIVAVGLVVGLAAGGSLAVLLVPAPVPGSLVSDQALDSVRPSVTEFSDPREVRVTLSVDTLSGVRSPRGGLVTTQSCLPGQEVAAGTSTFSVDGAPVVGLATSVPLWREIAVGESGADVGSLEAELVRLGGGLDIDGTWEWSDALAFDSLLADVGVTTNDEGAVPLAAIAWLPAPVTVIAQCPVGIGTSVAPGTIVAQFATRISSARLALPVGAVEGPRALVLSDVVIPVGDDGVIADPAALALIAQSPEFAESDPSATPPSISGSWVLTSPVPATVVPPSAVYGLAGDRGCVAQADSATAVTVLASELGRTLVVPAEPLGEVLVHPKGDVPCR
jgi:hypothetical protein